MFWERLAKCCFEDVCGSGPRAGLFYMSAAGIRMEELGEGTGVKQGGGALQKYKE